MLVYVMFVILTKTTSHSRSPLLYIYNPPLVIAIMIHLYRQNGARDRYLLILRADPFIALLFHDYDNVTHGLDTLISVLCYMYDTALHIPVR